MRINDQGDVLMPPKVISSEIVAMTAIAKAGPGKLNIWTIPIEERHRYPIRVGLVDLKSLAPVSFRNIGRQIGLPFSLQVKQNGGNRFLLAIDHGSRDSVTLVRSLFLNSSGAWNGSSVTFAPFYENVIAFVGGLSADGRMSLVSVDVEELPAANAPKRPTAYVAPLDAQGKPVSNQLVKLASTNPESVISSADISNLLTGGKRLVVFKEGYSRDFQPLPTRIYSILINGATGRSAGKKSLVFQSAGALSQVEYLQTLAVDPRGRFFVFSGLSFENCPGHLSLLYQRLDAAGEATGNRKVLVPCSFPTPDAFGLDLSLQ